ncbi:MAG: TolC family protein [Myxococcota bacterium]
MTATTPTPGPAALLALAVLAPGLWLHCAAPDVETSLPVEPPERFSRSGGAAVPERWWAAFDDSRLDGLVEEALRSNLDLKTAWERLREARAVVDRESSGLLPDVDAVLEGEIRRPEDTARDLEQLWLGLAADYEVDLWGRIRSSIQAEEHRARASHLDYRTAALSVSAEVARTWFRVIEARGRLALLEEQVEANEKVLDLLESRFASGQVRRVDVVRQRRLLESTRELEHTARADLAVSQHQVAVLLGRPPTAEVDGEDRNLPAPPPVPETGVPGELVKRRPDVRRAHSLLLAADREMAAAVADRYPRLSLSARAGTEGSTASELFEGWFVSLAANLLAPLFDGGEREAEVDRTAAVTRQRLYEYGQTALVAFREVEDALARERQHAERIRSLADQVDLARQASERLRVEYLNGVTDYIDVLTALTEEQRLRRDLLAARRALLEARVGLYRALAGGFETEREEEESG